MLTIADVIDTLAAETGFSGVVAVDVGGETEFARAYGYAHRPYEIPNTVDTRFAIASGSKGLTALTVVASVGYRRLPRRRDPVSLGTCKRGAEGGPVRSRCGRRLLQIG